VSDTVEEVTPKLFDHAKRVYDEMLRRSHKEMIGPQHNGEVDLSNTKEVDVYEGHLTTLFADLQIANPYYTRIMDALKGQNCMEQLRRGGGSAMSKWILHAPPTEEGFRAIMDRNRVPKGGVKMLEQRVKDLTRMVHGLTDEVESATRRIDRLEAKL